VRLTAWYLVLLAALLAGLSASAAVERWLELP